MRTATDAKSWQDSVLHAGRVPATRGNPAIAGFLFIGRFFVPCEAGFGQSLPKCRNQGVHAAYTVGCLDLLQPGLGGHVER